MLEAFFTLATIATLALVAATYGLVRQLAQRIQQQSTELSELRRQLRAAVPPADQPTRPTPAPAPAPPPPKTDNLQPSAPPSRPPPLPTIPAPPSRPGLATTEHRPPLSSAPPPRSRLAESAATALRKIWNWIVVGDEHRRPGVSLEYAVATTWSVRLGVLIFVLGIGFLLVWSAQRQLIGPTGRVALAFLTGVAMLIGGIRILGRKYHVMGQGLLGGGLLVLYFAAYAMGPRYEIVTLPVAFAFMVLVTLVAGVLALRLDSLLVAVTGLAGGYLTPVLLSSDVPRLAVLYAYLLLLGLAILALAYRKQWRFLNYLSFLGTYALYVASLTAYSPDRDFSLALGALAVFFVVQSSLVYLYNIARRLPVTTLELIHAVANALLTAAIGYFLILDAYGRPYPALLALALSAYFTAHVWLLLVRRSADRPLLIACIALAGAFATWTLPLVMAQESLTIALALLALMFLILGQKLGSRFLENVAHGLYLTVLFRLAVWDFARGYPHPASGAGAPSLHAYWSFALHRLWTFGTVIATVVAAFVLQQRRPRPATALAVPPGADTPLLLGTGPARHLFFWSALALGIAFLNCELWALFAGAPSWRYPALTLVWAAAAVYLLHAPPLAPPRLLLAAATVALVVAAGKLLGFDLDFWQCHPQLRYARAYHGLDVAARSLDFAILLTGVLLAWRHVRRHDDARTLAPAFGYAALALVFIYATLEWNTFTYWRFPRFRAGTLSILWALFGIAFIVGGIARNLRTLRLLGLALMAVVIAKVLVLDLRGMEIIVRVVAFLAVGVLLLLSAFAYMRANQKFIGQPPSPPPSPPDPQS